MTTLEDMIPYTETKEKVTWRKFPLSIHRTKSCFIALVTISPSKAKKTLCLLIQSLFLQKSHYYCKTSQTAQHATTVFIWDRTNRIPSLSPKKLRPRPDSRLSETSALSAGRDQLVGQLGMLFKPSHPRWSGLKSSLNMRVKSCLKQICEHFILVTLVICLFQQCLLSFQILWYL